MSRIKRQPPSKGKRNLSEKKQCGTGDWGREAPGNSCSADAWCSDALFLVHGAAAWCLVLGAENDAWYMLLVHGALCLVHGAGAWSAYDT